MIYTFENGIIEFFATAEQKVRGSKRDILFIKRRGGSLRCVCVPMSFYCGLQPI